MEEREVEDDEKKKEGTTRKVSALYLLETCTLAKLWKRW